MSDVTAGSSKMHRQTERGLAHGARWLTAGALVVGAVNYGYAFVLTRLLPTGEYADFAAGQALLLTAGTVAAVSVPWVLAQELVRSGDDAEQRRRAVWFSSVTNLGQGTLVGLAVGLIATTFCGWATSAAIAVSALLIFLASTSLGWFQGRQRFRAIAARGVAEVIGKAAAGFALVGVGAGAGGALAGFGIGSFVILAVGIWLMRAEYRPASGALRNRELWRSTRGVAGIQGLVSILASIDVVLVAVLPVASPAAASYQASMILARIPLFLAGAVAAVAFPMLGAPNASPAGLFRSGSRLYLVVALPLAVVLATAPRAVLSLLFPGTFDRVYELLPFTAAAGVLIGFVELLTTFFQAGGHYRRCTQRQLVGVLFSLVAVPVGWKGWGVTGIALAACTGAALTVLLLVLDARRLWPGSQSVRPAAPMTCAALALALLTLRQYPLIWLAGSAVALAACGYVAFLGAPRSPAERAGQP